MIFNEDSVFPPKMLPTLFGHESWSFVTMVRHPVDRIISHFGFDSVYIKHENILDWVEQAPFHTQNFMVRKFSSMWPLELSDEFLNNPSSLWSYELDKNPNSSYAIRNVTYRDLELAKEVLNQFSVVLVLELLTQSSSLLGHYFDIPITDTRARTWQQLPLDGSKKEKFHRPGSRKQHPLFKKILAYNELDMELYRHAVQLTRCNMERTMFQGIFDV
eukprot:CAMPEP_0114433948 /NCGR_PEP_ID=MMETSP0103-20121206/11979_1 /TAXON_ID=37642 ORGANISM="Paraphysomonas imperforata, Strain PA2" /NCGR_SAMPLE_ID=MMETSP0103 /ASSEMBLY_ACC=CAM_ASM_000201 /LENGTH=216 /DNA_ID=CAMNT_0001603761 /DNA_START=405 /DNA_END=1055 /DNA_ORIENTATION=-